VTLSNILPIGRRRVPQAHPTKRRSNMTKPDLPIVQEELDTTGKLDWSNLKTIANYAAEDDNKRFRRKVIKRPKKIENTISKDSNLLAQLKTEDGWPLDEWELTYLQAWANLADLAFRLYIDDTEIVDLIKLTAEIDGPEGKVKGG
jgi:hypothetical protein